MNGKEVARENQPNSYQYQCSSTGFKGKVIETLNNVFGFQDFINSVQEDAIKSVASASQDVFISMPTGAGKSLCYQLPALAGQRNGVTVVISPLIASMTVQVKQLQSRGICAETLNCTVSKEEIARVSEDLCSAYPCTKLLYVTPEQVFTDEFHSILDQLCKNRMFAYVAVDEAHCVSQWSHDFHPHYLKLGELRKKYSRVPWVALTITVSVTVMNDVLYYLNLKPPVAVFKASSFRSNIYYDVVFKECMDNPFDDLKSFALSALGKEWEFTKRGSGIVYCQTKESCEMVADKLTKLGLNSRPCHAGLKDEDQSQAQHDWMLGKISVIVTTIGFRKGTDIPSVRFVAHWSVAHSVDGYYQESGQAGGDGQPARCRIYYSREDRNLIMDILKKDEQAAKTQEEKIKAHSAYKSFKIMRKYCEEAHCRHSFLMKEFGDELYKCKKYCDVCYKPRSVDRRLDHFEATRVSKKKNSNHSVETSNELYEVERLEQKKEIYNCKNTSGDTNREDHIDRAVNSLSNTIKAELGKVKDEKLIKPPKNSRVLEPLSSFILDVNVNTREEYLSKLEEEIKANYNTCTPLLSGFRLEEQDILDCATDKEFSIFKTKKNIDMYKKEFAQVFKALRESSKNLELHPLLVCFDESHSASKRARNDTLVSGKDISKERSYSLCDTVTKSSLLKQEKLFSSSKDLASSTNLSNIAVIQRSSNFGYQLKNLIPSCASYSSIFTGTQNMVLKRNEVQDYEILKTLNSTEEEKKESSFSFERPPFAYERTGGPVEMDIEKIGANNYEYETCSSSFNPLMNNFIEIDNRSGTNNKSISRCVEKEEKSVSSNSGNSTFPQKRETHDNNNIEIAKKAKIMQSASTNPVHLKSAADLVRKFLNPKYKENKLSKEMFKKICRTLSHRLVDQNQVTEKHAKEAVDELFQKKRALNSIDDV
ncbi:ATP-dependent DNA helicase Q5-like [Limulus polyphemus]|uniref:ATP-dependent DNA helicase n=1 Tax=Limulus polyphemus TaxID=6850 RepID=A0ABM1BK78_LIMPO|nr:ATP-dependent DNA helicase Q5-like [Limulus polyphemus]XP_022251707.1 ATP-dependent DNA helicase Q5-like [Limulus polyphemus]